MIVSRHMDVLMSLEGVDAPNDTRRLRRLFDTVEAQVRGLKALGVSVESYGGLLSSVLLNKLPSEIRLIVNRGLLGDCERKGCGYSTEEASSPTNPTHCVNSCGTHEF